MGHIIELELYSIARCPMMRTVLSLLLFFVTIVLAQEPAQVIMPMFKGVELYSWKDTSTNEWRFVLVPGTNRLKTSEEILGNPQTLESVEALKEQVSALASGEQVFWQRTSAVFELPSTELLEDIVRYAATLGIKVHVPAAQ
jgi:hypothetical protein